MLLSKSQRRGSVLDCIGKPHAWFLFFEIFEDECVAVLFLGIVADVNAAQKSWGQAT